MTKEEMLRIYHILRSVYTPGDPITPSAADNLLRQYGITPQAMGFLRSRAMFEAMPEYISIHDRGLLFDLTLLDLSQPGEQKGHANLEPVTEVPPVDTPASTAPGSDLPLTFSDATITFPRVKQRSAAGYLEQVELTQANLNTIAQHYARQRSSGGMVFCGEDECVYFTSGLFSVATGKPILLALENVTDDSPCWRVSHASSRKPEDLADITPIPPMGDISVPAEEPESKPTPEVKPMESPEPVVDVPKSPPAHPDAPAQWRNNVLFHKKTQEILAGFLGLTALTPEMFRQIATDYDAALAAGNVTWVESKCCYSFPLSLVTPSREGLILALKTNDFPNGPPWRVSFVGKARVKPRPELRPKPIPEPKIELKAEPMPEPKLPMEAVPTPTPVAEPEGEASDTEITAPVFSRLSDRDKLEIYNTLLPLNPVGSNLLLSLAGETLTTHGITPQRYGYSRFLQMVADMPEYFRLTSARPKPDAPQIYSITMLPLPQAGGEPLFPVVDTATSDKPPFAMTERTIAFPPSQQGHLSRFINSTELDAPTEKLSEEQIAEFRNSYDSAVASGTLVYDPTHQCWCFPLTLTAKDGRALNATIRRSDRPAPPNWYVSFIQKSNVRGVRPGGKLMQFAFLGAPGEFLLSLAAHAEPEKWGFSDDPNDFSILWNYISYTFYRLDYEGKIYVDPHEEFAAFNTGLLSRRFGEDLYAYFEPNTEGSASKWKFVCFCSGTNEAHSGVEKKAVARLLPLQLELPRYFVSFYDTMFDPDSTLESNFMHIIRDNLSRFPMSWLHKQCDDHDRTRVMLAEIEKEMARCTELKACHGPRSPEVTASHHRQKELFRLLGEAVCDESDDNMCDLLMDMKDLFEGAVNRTVERCRRNFKLAVPCYFPTRNVMSMLLPISFSRAKNGAPCLALVAERQKNGVYMGRTVLTMSMAYNDARLLCRPTSEWLDAAHIYEESGLDDSLDD